ncbi:uncharacterized protein CC84DRAFT_1162496 [Paraphaeosphaeria sporulosa]|uniref:RNA ligase domain-containing protein n=1 Tax=Paraphaeosphaeria sporulosa TaxID=1460663 RepID=A0A177CMP3_9PLEO|nr:uncharacterized protein CC84DRAFT_1162496 [Paraphaeosphaeria sporulosa]OAG08566.1 hypothetical protein CC84DRAFT_1162496 [Paraphaeosphaeria sporulosa]
MASESKSTLYPKITTHIKEVIKTLKYKLRDPDKPEEEPVTGPISIVGTVKLHGTHADILVSSDNTITLQSRNNSVLLETADNLGFAKSMSTKRPAILRLRDEFLVRWKKLNPEETLDTALPVTIAGEWVGEKIQKGVAISKLSRRLVIISAKINGSWVADVDYADIEAVEDDIYNISRAGTYRSVLYPEEPQRTIDALEPLADTIAARCPFAATFGVTGEGEGLVWKLVPYISDSDLWFKTKGGRFKPTFTPAPKKPPVDQAEKREAAQELAQAWCSEQRLEQGWDYLRENGLEQTMKGIGAFLKWLQLDILSEEKGYITEHKVDEDLLRKEIIARGKPWYLERYHVA